VSKSNAEFGAQEAKKYAMWIWILILFIVGGAILGILKSDSGKETEGCLFGAFSGLMEGGGCLLYLLLMLIFLIALMWLFT